MSFKSIVEAYSLAKDEVGKPITDLYVETVHPDGRGALLALDSAIRNHQCTPGRGLRFQIELPDGRKLPFDAAYTAIFGEAPVRHDYQESRYPRLTCRKPKTASPGV